LSAAAAAAAASSAAMTSLTREIRSRNGISQSPGDCVIWLSLNLTLQSLILESLIQISESLI
jgi:hypothetical protein